MHYFPTTGAQQDCQHDFARDENPLSTTYALGCRLGWVEKIESCRTKSAGRGKYGGVHR